MGASAKRKKEKSQDFKKAKLKVGKTQPKAANATNTSFKARSIVLNQQSLSSSAPISSALFTHQLSLVGSKQDSQRRDALSSLTNTLSLLPQGASLPQPAVTIILKVRSLLIDGSRQVREQTLKLLRTLPSSDTKNHIDDILIYVHIGMTHMAADIRSSSMDVLEWLLQEAGQETVGCAGGWLKTIRRLCSVLGWQAVATSGVGGVAPGGTTDKWTSSQAGGRPGTGDGKLRAKQISTLALFLSTGLTLPALDEAAVAKKAALTFPLWNVDAHCIGDRANPFGYLNLFDAMRDEENEMYDDAESRKEVYRTFTHETVLKGMQEAKKEGGEVGRAAAALDKAVTEGTRE